MPLVAQELVQGNHPSIASSPRDAGKTTRLSSDGSKGSSLLYPTAMNTTSRQQEDVAMTLLDNPWVAKLGEEERQMLCKIAPFLSSNATSASQLHRCSTINQVPLLASSVKTLSDILFLTRLVESEVMQLLDKLPFIKVVRKACI